MRYKKNNENVNAKKDKKEEEKSIKSRDCSYYQNENIKIVFIF